MLVHLTKQSSNRKVGPIPVSTTSRDSCPPSCPLKNNGCYAKFRPLRHHWDKVTYGKRGTDWHTFCQQIEALPAGQLWRHNQAGDLLPSRYRNRISKVKLKQLVKANKGKRGFTYTHYPVLNSPDNRIAIRRANYGGFTINISANFPAQADCYAQLKIAPVVTTLQSVGRTYDPETATFGGPKREYTPQGRLIVVCPAQLHEHITCATCQLCQKQNRPIIGFVAHGMGKRKVNLTIGATA